MIIQKIFSDQEEEELLYSVLMDEEELALFSEIQKEFTGGVKRANKIAKKAWEAKEGVRLSHFDSSDVRRAIGVKSRAETLGLRSRYNASGGGFDFTFKKNPNIHQKINRKEFISSSSKTRNGRNVSEGLYSPEDVSGGRLNGGKKHFEKSKRDLSVVNTKGDKLKPGSKELHDSGNLASKKNMESHLNDIKNLGNGEYFW